MEFSIFDFFFGFFFLKRAMLSLDCFDAVFPNVGCGRPNATAGTDQVRNKEKQIHIDVSHQI